MNFGHNETLFCAILSMDLMKEMTTTNFRPKIASLVVAHCSCMHIVLFVNKYTYVVEFLSILLLKYV